MRTLRRLLERRVLGKPLGVWLLWAMAVGVLAGCPVIISDPAMWPYLLDPELLALVVVIGAQYTRLELGVAHLQLQAWWAGRRAWAPLTTRRATRLRGSRSRSRSSTRP